LTGERTKRDPGSVESRHADVVFAQVNAVRCCGE